MRHWRRAVMMGACALGCGSAATEQDGGSDTCDAANCVDDDGSATQTADDDGGTTHAVDDTAGDVDTGEPGGGLPCDVVEVIDRNCFGCHSDPPKFGAPMPFASWGDFQVPAVSDPERKVIDLVGDRIVDPDFPMPPITAMSGEDQTVLLDWIAAGAPSDPSAACTPTDPTGGDDVGPDALPCEPTHTFLAHASGSEDAFQVPPEGADNLYMCFTFASPFAANVQGTAWAPITDDERVLHHWILYRTATPQVDGGVGPCNMPSDQVFVSGWAPGGQNFVMPDDVGLELGGPDDYYILQVHYHNTENHTDAFDGSGVAFCTTDTPRAQTAGVLTLGTFSIDVGADAEDAKAVGTCPSQLTSLLPQSLFALASFPHMHQLGREFNTTITRGAEELTLVDVPSFTFDNQISYPHDPPIEIKSGDTLTTTCTYDNPGGGPVGFGEDTEDEMCFNFVLTYPIDIVPEDYRVCMTG